MKLREYQERAIEDIRGHFRNGHRAVCLVAPTGAGKTVLASSMIRGAVKKNLRVIFLAHRRKLIDQASEKLDAFGVKHGVIMRGHDYDPWQLCQVASVQTLVRRKYAHPDLLVVDECHHVRGASYTLVASQAKKIVGLTATPCRLDGKSLGDVFERLVICEKPKRLVEQGFLVPERIFAPYVPDMAGVKKSHGDYSIGQLRELMDRPGLTADIVEQWLRHALGRPTVAFCVDVAHSKRITQRFQDAGVRAAHIDAHTPDEERDRVLHGLATGETEVVANCGVLTEGWDQPCTSAAILARPTASLGLHIQMGGRVLRPSPGKEDALILDHAGNCLRHGTLTEDREWGLEARRKRKSADESVPSLKQCPECFMLWPNHVTECSNCGHVWEVKEKEELGEGFGELRETDSVLVVLARNPSLEDRVVFWTGAERMRRERGYKPGWSKWQFKEAFGHWPSRYILDLSRQYARAQERKLEVRNRD